MKNLKRLAAKLDDHGRNGDTIVAHINPREAALLKALGGAATINPRTGLLEFYGSDPMGGGSDYGSTNDGLGGGAGGGFGDGLGPADNSQNNANNGNVGLGAGGTFGGGAGEAMMGEDRATAPNLGFAFGGNELAGAQGFGRAGAFAGRQVDKALDNPVATGINALASMALGPIGMANMLSGWVGGPTLGGMATAAGRAATGYGASPATGASAGNASPPGPGSANDGGFGPSGSGNSPLGGNSVNSPLAQALLGTSPDNGMGGRMAYGPRVSSYSPYGREYTTPWAYRG